MTDGEGSTDRFRRETHERDLREQWQEAHERETQLAKEYQEEALRLQRDEYLRRLDALNGEAGRIRDILATCVPREIFEAYQKEQAAAGKLLADRVNASQEQLSQQTQIDLRRLEAGIRELREEQKNVVGQRTGGERTSTIALSIGFFIVSILSLAATVILSTR